MTDKDNAGRRQLAEVAGYESHRLPVDPWGRQVAHLCTRCGAWVGDTVAHDMDHADREVITAPLTVERLARPSDLRTMARQIRSRYPVPRGDMDPGQYISSQAMHALADCLETFAGPDPKDPHVEP